MDPRLRTTCIGVLHESKSKFSPKKVGPNSLQGAAYVFIQSGTAWTEQQRLTASDGAAYDQLGSSVSVSGGIAVAGAPGKMVGSNSVQGTAYVFNLGPANGTSCTKAADCGSGFCIDAFCCDTSCTGLCQACAAALKQTGKDDGVCGPALTGTNPHKDACPIDPPATCGHDGLCDGAGLCRLHPPTGTICATKCDANQETDSTCDGNSKCTLSGPVSCGNYLCDATKCKTSCSTKSDCSAAYACQAGKCVAGATCMGTDSQGADGKIIHCAPYQCDTGGTCKSTCNSVDDCVAPATCDPSHNCVAPAASSAGCSTSGGTGAASGFAMWLVIGVIARRRRKSRLTV